MTASGSSAAEEEPSGARQESWPPMTDMERPPRFTTRSGRDLAVVAPAASSSPSPSAQLRRWVAPPISSGETPSPPAPPPVRDAMRPGTALVGEAPLARSSDVSSSAPSSPALRRALPDESEGVPDVSCCSCGRSNVGGSVGGARGREASRSALRSAIDFLAAPAQREAPTIMATCECTFDALTLSRRRTRSGSSSLMLSGVNLAVWRTSKRVKRASISRRLSSSAASAGASASAEPSARNSTTTSVRAWAALASLCALASSTAWTAAATSAKPRAVATVAASMTLAASALCACQP